MKLKNILRKRLQLGENRRIEKPMTKKKRANLEDSFKQKEYPSPKQHYLILILFYFLRVKVLVLD
jgi:hypothetical protein